MFERINKAALEAACDAFDEAEPFPHMIIDGFFAEDLADALSKEVPAYDDGVWHSYDNPIEIKRVCNNWNVFPNLTYQVFQFFNSPEFVGFLSAKLGIEPLYADPGLNGGGWHAHAAGGKLNVHVDYSLHPKLGTQRKLNLLVYMTPGWREEWGGHLGLWRREAGGEGEPELVVKIAPVFNRAVLFDTTQDSWHGLPEPIRCPEGITRTSIAVYYLTDPPAGVDTRGKALFVPYGSQKEDPEILELIRKRSDVRTASGVYRRK